MKLSLMTPAKPYEFYLTYKENGRTTQNQTQLLQLVAVF